MRCAGLILRVPLSLRRPGGREFDRRITHRRTEPEVGPNRDRSEANHHTAHDERRHKLLQALQPNPRQTPHPGTHSISGGRMLRIASGIASLLLVAQSASAVPPPDPQALALSALEAAATEPIRIHFAHGFPTVIRANVQLTGADAVARANSLLTSFPSLFRQSDANLALHLRAVHSDGADEIVSFSQTYAGLPVFNSVLTIVNREPVIGTSTWTLGLAVGQLMVDDVLPLDLDILPAVTAASAEAAARTFLARPGAPVLGATELGIINPDVHDIIDPEVHLVYRVTLGGGAPHQLYVDAHTLAVDFEHTLVEEAYADFDLDLEHAHDANMVGTNCFNSIPLPVAEQIGDESGLDAPWSGDLDAVTADIGINRTVDFYFDSLGRRSWDDDDDEVVMYVHSNFGPNNARYKHGCGIEFGDNYVSTDTVTHEFTHGVIRHSLSNLVYKDQSGALNESYADTMAAFADWSEDWLHGEDNINGQGPTRSLKSPNGPDCGPSSSDACGDPDHMSIYCTTPNCDADNGGVHTNSGIPNKAHFLISEGGPHNGFNIAGIGNTKAQRLIYLVLRILPPNAKFATAATVTSGIAEGWGNSGKNGFTPADACEVRNAWAAVGVFDSIDLNCDGIPDSTDDTDGDRIAAVDDNCPNDSNPGQADRDIDGIGDVCDSDDDGDGWPNGADNCPGDYQPGDLNTDLDGDGDGNGCDTDDDGDTVPDVSDNCQWTPNLDQLDSCGGPAGDACDFDIDIDADGVCGTTDNCPFVYNPGLIFPSNQLDTDGDGLGDACDACPSVDDNANAYTTGIPQLGVDPIPLQPDTDGDGTPDACDALGFGGAALLVAGLPYNPTHPLVGNFFPSSIQITGSVGDVIEVALPVCPDSGRSSAGPDDRVELIFTGLEDAVRVAILDETGAAVATSDSPVVAGRGVRFRPDCIHQYRLRLRMDTGFSGSDSSTLGINNVIANTSNPWTATPGLGFLPPVPPADTDADGIWDIIDSCPAVADPSNRDTDLDGDGNVCDSDDDNDGLLDSVENNTGVYVSPLMAGTNPLLADTDGDGFDDGVEVSAGTDPNDSLSFPVTPVPLLGPWGLAGLMALLASLAWMKVSRANVT